MVHFLCAGTIVFFIIGSYAGNVMSKSWLLTPAQDNIQDSHMAPYGACEVAQNEFRSCSEISREISWSELGTVDMDFKNSLEAVQ